ncbi:MAG: translocation/assembly module TamB domain-containing protein [Bacteroidales bacterium]|nr:translocation/assembly module TamB domain-containing protein [Bacteroidales bacterium]
MKRGFRITLWILAAIVILLLALVVAIQSPTVQTALARKAISVLSDKIDGDITVGRISVRPFDAVTLENVIVRDRTPYSDGAFPRQHTLLSVGHLSARFSIRGLLRKERISVSRLRLEDGEFNLVIEPGPDGKDTNNLSRVFRLKSDPDKEKKEFGDLLEAGRVELENFTFRMINHPAAAKMRAKGHPPVPDNVIDWNNLEVKVNARVSDILVKDGEIRANVGHLRIADKTGLDLQDVSGKVNVGHGKVLLDNLHIKDNDSDLHLRYFRLLGTLDDEYKDFVDRVRLEGEFVSPSVLSMQTVSHFAPNMDQMTFKADIAGKVEGTISDFNLRGLTFHEYGSGVQARVDGSMRGLPFIETTDLDFQVKDFQFDLDGLATFIKEWAPDTKLDLKKMGRGTEFNLDATVQGTLNRLAVNGNLESNAGTADVDLVLRDVIDKKRDISIGGTLKTKDLDAGRIAGIDALGPVTLTTAVDASLAKGNLHVRLDTLKVDRLRAMGYDYTGIQASGRYANDAFDGRISCNDPNLNMLLQGKFDVSPKNRDAAYQFHADVFYADLNALNIDKRGPSKVSFLADGNLVRTRDKDLLGDVNLRDVVLENAAGRYNIGDITARANEIDGTHKIRFESSFAEGDFSGQKPILAMVNDLKDLLVHKELPSLLEKPGTPWDGTPYEVDFKFFDTREVLAYALPGLYVEKNTSLNLKVDEEGHVDGNVTSGRLALGGKYLKDFKLNFNNRGDALHAALTGSDINLGGFDLRGNKLDLTADDDRFTLAYSFDNQEDQLNKADLRFEGKLTRHPDGLAVTANTLPSAIWYEGNRWDLNSDEVTYRNGDIEVERFSITNGAQSLVLEGGLSPNRADTLAVRMDRFDISLLNTLLMDGKMDFKGQATGRANLVSPTKPSLSLLASISCDSTYVAGRPMGRLQLGSVWNEPEKRFDIRIRNLNEGVRNFDIDGFYRPKDKTIRADAVLNHLDMAYASPFLAGIFDRFGGGLDGKVSVDGTLDKLRIDSEGLKIVDGLLGIEFTQVLYHVVGPVALDTEGLHFKEVSLTDESDGKGTVTGSLLFGGFKNMRLDTHVQFDRMKVLGITDRNAPIYGDVFGTGRVDITGPFDAIALNIDARTVKDGDLHIPLGAGTAKATGDLLVFTSPFEEYEEDEYESMMGSTRNNKKKSSGNLDIRVRVRATPSVMAHIDIGENNLRGLGSGLIDLRIRTGQNSLFNINGDYTLSQGNFRFSALDVVTRDFTIKEGSSIRFNGDVMDSDLNVTGLYSTKADISTLVSTAASKDTGGSRREVDCLLDITGKLRNPQIKFNIDIPELDPGTEGLVQSALNTEDKVMKQFLYLLIANSFLPNEESGIISTNGSNMLYSNMTGIMAGQLNSIFQRLNIPLDLGLNYQQNSAGQNLFDVALSTQLFNNRVVVNGTIGNRRLYGTTTDEVAGDLDIDIKLDKPGTFRLNLFSHSADQYTSFLDNSQRNGVGIAYQREFNDFKQFFRDMFTPRKERDQEVPQGAAGRVVLQIDSTGHAQPLAQPTPTPVNE